MGRPSSFLLMGKMVIYNGKMEMGIYFWFS